MIIDYGAPKGRHNETIIKELTLVADDVIRTLHFQAPYDMRPHGSAENGLNWDDGHISYHQLQTTVTEAVSGYGHLYSYGIEKCRELSYQLRRPVLTLENFKCSSPRELPPSRYSCGLSCHKFPNVSCAIRNAYSCYECFLYDFKTKSYVKCPQDMTRHTAMFVSGV